MNELGISQSMTALTYEKLRNAIVTAHFRPGEKLRIEALKEEFDTGIGAVREALSALTSEGLVVARPQRGFTVALISRQDLIYLTDVRVEVEGLCIEQAIRHGDVEWEGSVVSVTHRLLRLTNERPGPTSTNAQEWHQLHEHFHDEITAACPNFWWLRLRKQLYIQSERYRWLSGSVSTDVRDVDKEHNEIAQAVLARDSGAARELLTQHLRKTTELLLNSDALFADDDDSVSDAAGKRRIALVYRDM